jgi:hypothetical protein
MRFTLMNAGRCRAALAAVAVLAAAAAAACNDVTGDCTDELRINLQPRDPTIAPGESFTAMIELSTCAGRERWRPEVVWRAQDTTVVRVDSLTGRVTGRAIGETQVVPVERRAGGGETQHGWILVRVRP